MILLLIYEMEIIAGAREVMYNSTTVQYHSLK